MTGTVDNNWDNKPVVSCFLFLKMFEKSSRFQLLL